MAVRSFYSGGERNLGAPAVVDFLTSYFATRKSMNDAAAQQDTGEDPDELSKLELRARETLGDLQRTLTEAVRQGKNDDSELEREYIRQQAGLLKESSQAGTERMKARLNLTQKLLEQATRENDEINKDAEIDDETLNSMRTIMAGVKNGDNPQITYNKFKAVADAANAGAPGSVKYDAMAMALSKMLIEENVADVADRNKLLNPAAPAGVTPTEWFFQRHRAATYDEQVKRAEEESRKAGSGGVPRGALLESMAQAGISVEDLKGDGGEMTSSRTSTRGAGGGPVPMSGGVSVGGNPEAAQAYFAAREAGEDPYAAMQAAIRAQVKFADDLAARREAALLDRKSRSIYPRANPYLANPNTMVSAAGQRAARKVGEMDPGIARERGGALLRNDGNINAAYREMGPLEAEFAPREYNAESITGGDLGAWLAENLGRGATVNGDGGYTYDVTPDLSVTIKAGPKGGGTKVPVGSEAWAAIMEEIGDEVPAIRARRVLSAQPAEVQALFGEAATLAKAGKDVEAAKAAGKVDAEDVRSAYGMAMRRGSSGGEELGRLTMAIDALPDDVGGTFKRAYTDALDGYAANRARGGRLADTQVLGSVEALGGALLDRRGLRGRREDRERRETVEAREDQSARTEFQRGREMGLQAWDRVKDDDVALGKLWDGLQMAKDTEIGRGAMAGFEESMAGRAGTVFKQRTGTLPMAVAVKAPSDTVALGGDVNARDWSAQKDPEFEAFGATLTETKATEAKPGNAKTAKPAKTETEFDEFDAFMGSEPKQEK